MKINVHIERLILEGLPVSSWQGSQIRSAVQKELTRLLLAGGLPDELRGGIALPGIQAGRDSSWPGLSTGQAWARHREDSL